MGMAKVTRNFQVTIPRDTRKVLNIKVGETLLISPSEKEAVIKKIGKNVVEETFGAWGKGEDAVKFVRTIRDSNEKIRMKRLGL